MRTTDVMVHDVFTLRPEPDLAEAVKLLAEHDVSALPVVDADNKVVGVLSEADLIHRVEIGTEKHRPWWLEALTGAGTLAQGFAKSHGQKVGEVMTSDVITVVEYTPARANWPAWLASPTCSRPWHVRRPHGPA
jgi:CBS-domain-containing membrane protein